MREPCSFTHASRRLCLGKPRSLGGLLWSATSTEAGTAPSRKARLRAQKIRAGQVASSPSRIRTHHGRFFVVVVAHCWTWRRLERRRRTFPLLRGRDGNHSCHANRGSLASLKFTAHGAAWILHREDLQSERLWCHCRVLRTSRRCIERLWRSRFAPTFSSVVADAATQRTSPLLSILRTPAPHRSRAGHIHSCGARWYFHSYNNRSQKSTSHLARTPIRTTVSCLT